MCGMNVNEISSSCLKIATMVSSKIAKPWNHTLQQNKNCYHFVGHCSAFCVLKCTLARSHARVIVQNFFGHFFKVFIFLMPSKVMIMVRRCVFLDTDMFWALLRSF